MDFLAKGKLPVADVAAIHKGPHAQASRALVFELEHAKSLHIESYLEQQGAWRCVRVFGSADRIIIDSNGVVPLLFACPRHQAPATRGQAAASAVRTSAGRDLEPVFLM